MKVLNQQFTSFHALIPSFKRESNGIYFPRSWLSDMPVTPQEKLMLEHGNENEAQIP